MPEPGPNVRWVGGKFGQAASSPSGSKTGGEGRGRGEKTILALAWKHGNSMVHNYHFVQ